MPYSDNHDERPLLADGPDEDEEEADLESTWQRRNTGDSIPDASAASSEDLRIRSISPHPIESTTTLPLPVWLREAAPSFRWGWVPLPMRKTARSALEWTKGPKQPQIQRINPYLPVVQELPIRLVRRFLPRRWQNAVALLVLYFAWALTFSLVIRDSAHSGDIRDYGVPANLWCGASLWSGAKGCGLDGNNCRPFTNASMAFRCNANCASLHVLNTYPVGDQEVLYEPFVVGGPPSNRSDETGTAVYRGDSFICQAAVHAGIVSNAAGGCGILHLTGPQTSFAASTGGAGIASWGFDSYFPKSFTLEATDADECGVVDMRWPLLGVTLGFTIVVSLFVTSPAIFFSSILTMLFFHVGFVSDKPNIASYADLASVMFGRFLPTALAAYPLYRFAARPQLGGLTAQVEKTVLWVGGAWVGALSNYTLEFIPLQRLTPEDLKQPGAVLSLVLICGLIFAIACGQVYYLRQEGRLRRYLAVYCTMAAGLLVLVALPTHHLRIHHYVLALLLLPGTRPQTRPGLLYQGLLLGLYVNGTARWGWDSVLQTAAALRLGGSDGPVRDTPLPNVAATTTTTTTPAWRGDNNSAPASLALVWPALPPPGFDGLSVVVNDVERHRWYLGEGAPAFVYRDGSGQGHWWGGGNDGGDDDGGDEDNGGGRRRRRHREYFRFAYLSGSDAQDYTKAAVWELDGSWTPMEDGPS